MSRVHFRITGRVQGVFFRASACDAAERIGVQGWVRNLPDGAVETEFEGTPQAVETMRAWCMHGPPSARVDEVAQLPVTAAPPYEGFKTTRA